MFSRIIPGFADIREYVGMFPVFPRLTFNGKVFTSSGEVMLIPLVFGNLYCFGVWFPIFGNAVDIRIFPKKRTMAQ